MDKTDCIRVVRATKVGCRKVEISTRVKISVRVVSRLVMIRRELLLSLSRWMNSWWEGLMNNGTIMSITTRGLNPKSGHRLSKRTTMTRRLFVSYRWDWKSKDKSLGWWNRRSPTCKMLLATLGRNKIKINQKTVIHPLYLLLSNKIMINTSIWTRLSDQEDCSIGRVNKDLTPSKRHWNY
jgi:hypothetical protein